MAITTGVSVLDRTDQQRTDARHAKDLLGDHRPRKIPGSCRATMVITGMSALRSTCQRTVRSSVRPLARAVVIKSWWMTSSIDARTKRVNEAASNRPSTAIGMAACLKMFYDPTYAAGLDGCAVDKWQPIQVQAEQQDKQQAGEERRRGMADKRKRRGDLIEERIWPYCRYHAHRQGDQQRQTIGRTEHEQCGRQPLQNRVDIDSAGKGIAPIARSMEVNQRT